MALAYAERFCLEAAMSRLETLKLPSDNSVKDLITKAIRLHCLLYLKENLGWYMMHGIVNQKAAASLDEDYLKAVKDLLPHTNNVL